MVWSTLAFTLSGEISHAAVFMDVASLTPGGIGVGTFTGSLGGISVSGTISPFAGSPSVFSFNPPGPTLANSTLDGSSPQYSYGTVYSPTAALTDRVGFTYTSGATNLVTIAFGAPVTNPVFHVANLTGVAFNFSPTPGFTTLTLLAGNGGGGDGIDPSFGGVPYGFAHVQDLTIGTADATPPTSSPPIAGPRSAYGSLQIDGTFTSIAFLTDGMGPPSDDGSFTLSIVPEPSAAMLALLGLASASLVRRRGCR